MNNLEPMKNCRGVQGNLNLMPGYNFSMEYLMMCKVYTDVGGIK